MPVSPIELYEWSNAPEHLKDKILEIYPEIGDWEIQMIIKCRTDVTLPSWNHTPREWVADLPGPYELFIVRSGTHANAHNESR